MRIAGEAGGIWYHGSDKVFSVLREGSTIAVEGTC